MIKLMLLVLPVLLVAACGRDEVRTYQVPKEKPLAPIQQMEARVDPATKAPTSDAGFDASLPDGWAEVLSKSSMRMVSYSIKGTAIDFYLIPLNMGDVPSNVNRWRGQVGLSPASPKAISGDLKSFQVDGHEVNYIEIYNAEGGKGIIAAIVDLAPTYWYFTAKGSVDELQSNAADIRKFLESITFEGHDH